MATGCGISHGLWLRVALCCLAALALASCRGKKSQAEYEYVDVDAVPLAVLCEAIDSDSVARLPWTDVYMPFTATISEPAEMTFSGRALMVRGAGISLSIRVMGIEGGVGYILPDSVHVVDKYHKMYFGDSLGALLGRYELSVDNVQDLLLGVPFVPAESLAPIAWGALDADGATLSVLDFYNDGVGEAVCSYAKPVLTDHGPFSPAVTIQALSADSTASVQLEVAWSLDDAKWDTGRSMRFKTPGYPRIGLSDLRF